MHFSDALIHLNAGSGIRRSGWNGKGLSVYRSNGIEIPNVGTLEPFFYLISVTGVQSIQSTDGKFSTAVNKRINMWVPSSADLTANDWEVLT